MEAWLGLRTVRDISDTIFLDETNFEAQSSDHVEELGGMGVIVRRGHSARSTYVENGLD